MTQEWRQALTDEELRLLGQIEDCEWLDADDHALSDDTVRLIWRLLRTLAHTRSELPCLELTRIFENGRVRYRCANLLPDFTQETPV